MLSAKHLNTALLNAQGKCQLTCTHTLDSRVFESLQHLPANGEQTQLAATTLMIKYIPPIGAPTESLSKQRRHFFCTPAALNYERHVNLKLMHK